MANALACVLISTYSDTNSEGSLPTRLTQVFFTEPIRRIQSTGVTGFYQISISNDGVHQTHMPSITLVRHFSPKWLYQVNLYILPFMGFCFS